MAKKHGFLKTLATLGGLAAAAAVAYQRREEIKTLVKDLTERLTPEDEPVPDDEDFEEEEADIVIDITIDRDEPETPETEAAEEESAGE